MPLVRFGVRSEYALGQPELYREVDREDPKAILDGVAVAGLVGILRQLGDLAEFAAEVFHGLQEQVTSTASRSHRLKVRVQNIEAALPPIEKAILAQNSHIHFAYTAGSEWHPRIKNEQNHFIYNDLPRFIMDSYEECRDPPRLHLLDKFDTGGPGSCLKRYSDPTFFRRASGGFREPDGEKVQRDKKARKIKKKRSLQRKGSSLRNGSISSQSTRFQFFPSAGNGRTSPSHTASSIDMTLKSDLGDRSNSFDSRSGSSHIECVFRPSSSVQPEEQESNGFCSRSSQQDDDIRKSSFSGEQPEERESNGFCSRSFQQDDDIRKSSFSGEQPGVADNSFVHTPSPEQVAPSSSCVTWDEKEEISEAKSQHYEGDEAPADIFVADPVVVDVEESRAVAEIHIPEDVTFEEENIRGPSSSFTRLDDAESEPDNFMDALNTIDTESETDVDYQTKHEVKQVQSLSTSDDGRMGDALNVVSADDTSDHPHPQIVDLASPDISPNNEMAADVFISVPSISPAKEQAPAVSEESSSASDSESGTLASTCTDPQDGSKEVESAIFDRSSSGIAVPEVQELLPDRVLNSPNKPQESPLPELSRVESIKIWTNGGLLGLEPSKPPVFNVSNTASQGSETSTTEVVNSPAPINNGDTRKLNEDGKSIERLASSRSPASWHGDDVAKANKHSSDSHCRSRFHPYGGGLTANGLPLATDVKSTSEEASHEHDGHSSQNIFGLGQRLLANGFRKKISLAPSCEPELPNSSPQKSKQPFVKFQASPLDMRFVHKSADYHLTSSPPLEHMKISFQPTDAFEAFSKLKLKFPDGTNYCNESSSGDLFPSFQLVPEAAAIGRNDLVSDSDDDDDTFCRSSPYMSDDDCHSRRSNTDSEEQWEAGRSPESSDDALCVIPAAEETAHAENGGAVSCLSATDLDLPSFDAVKPPLEDVRQEDLDRLSSLELLQHPKASSPLPPPLPPAQWRATKPISEPQATFDAHQPKPAPAMTQQPKPAPASEQQPIHQVIIPFKDEQKMNYVKGVNQPANGKVTDENEDFLHQIRSKSFSLRRTTPAKMIAAETTANNRVTEILKKANAIRQVVASDVDDDDAWSDDP